MTTHWNFVYLHKRCAAFGQRQGPWFWQMGRHTICMSSYTRHGLRVGLGGRTTEYATLPSWSLQDITIA